VRALKFQVRYPDGRSEEFVVDAERVLIGSGAHCEIRLPVDQAAIEHVLVQLSGAGAFAEARSFNPPPTLHGSPFSKVQLMPDALLGVGSVQIGVSVVEVAGDAGLVHKKQEKTSPMTYILAAIAVPISLYVILSDSGDAVTAAPPKEYPKLFDEPVATCPQQAPEQAAAFANDKLALANARRERRPFHVQDGVAAVPLYEQAAACFKAGGDPEAARDAEEAGSQLRAQVEEDYRTHRVRLEHAMTVKDWRTAQKEVRVLLAFTEGKQGEYVTWLSTIDRRLQLKYGKKAP
jgi:hypothetical protein